MKTFNQKQRGSAVIWIIAIVVIAAVVYFIAANSNKSATTGTVATSTDQQTLATTTVTIMVPSDLAAFRKAAVEHVQVGGPDPLPITTFIPVKAIPNTIVADARQNAAEAAAEYLPTQTGTTSLIVYFKVVNSTAYILLSMDIDGWAGVSSAIAQVHPIVEKTLLAQPGITAVKFGPAPGDTIDGIQKEYENRSANPTPVTSSTSNWKTYTNSKYSFSFQYPPSSPTQPNRGPFNTLKDGSVALGQNGNYYVIVHMPKVITDGTGKLWTIKDYISDCYPNKGDTCTNIVVGGINSFERSSSQIGTIVYVPFSSNKILEVVGSVGDPMFNQILSTFKFTK